MAIPTVGTGVLTSSAALASVLWVTVSLPDIPLLRGLGGGDTTSVAISLQSALLGIDDGNGRNVLDENGLARALGLTSGVQLPSPADIRGFAAHPATSSRGVIQLAVLRIDRPALSATPAPAGSVPQHIDTTPAPATTRAPATATANTLTAAATVKTPPVSTPTPSAAPTNRPAPVETPTPRPQPPVTPTPKPSVAPTPKPKPKPPVVTLPPPATPPAVPPAPQPTPPPVATPSSDPPADPAGSDTTAPVVQAHADVRFDAGASWGAVVPYTPPSATDSVDGSVSVVCAPTSGSTFALGSTTVTCNAEDAAHNVAQSIFSVVVQDLTGPSLQLPANSQVATTSAAGAYVNYSARAVDAVDGTDLISCAPTSGSLFSVGDTTVSCTSEDAAHNISQGSFTVSVLADTAPPSVQPHADVNAEATGPSGAAVSYVAPTATDTVDGPVSAACAPASGTVFPLGSTTVTCTVEDASRNVAQSTFTVFVHDTTSPTISAHPDLTAEATTSGNAVTYTPPSASDLVAGTVSVTCAPVSGSTFALGHTTVTCSSRDSAGNGASRQFDVFVRDTTAPVIQTRVDIVAEATSTNGANVTYTSPSASDSLDGPVPVTCAPVSGATFALGHTTVTCSTQDGAGNSASGQFDVFVRDTTGPVIQASADLVVEASGPSGAGVGFTVPTATDAVSGSRAVICAPGSGAVFALGHTTVTCSSQDGAGNSASRQFDVFVRDTVGPVMQAHADLVVEASGPAGASVSYIAPTATDAVSGSRAVVCAPVSNAMFALGHTTVTCSSQDGAGNSASRQFDVFVRDTTGPVMQAHADLVVEATGPAGASVGYIASTATDAVSGSTAVVCAPVSGAVFALGHTTVTCSSQDGAGNGASRQFDVFVRDTTAPVIQAHADLVVEASGPSGASVSFTVPTATDAVSGSRAVVCAPVSNAMFALGHTTVTCSSQDGAGNSASRQFDVFVRDTTAPVIQAHANLVVEATGPAGASVSFLTPTATDAVSGGRTVVCAPVSGSVFALGHTTVTCSSQDGAGNSASRQFDVFVRDTTAPLITLPADFTVQASSSAGIAVTFASTATDTVDGTDPVICSRASGTTFPVGHTVVSCTAQDNAGNSSSQTLDVFVTTSQTIYDGAVSMLGLFSTLNSLNLSSAVSASLRSELITAGISWITGDAVAACQNFDIFAASTSAQLSAAQYAQIGPSIAATRQTLGC